MFSCMTLLFSYQISIAHSLICYENPHHVVLWNNLKNMRDTDNAYGLADLKIIMIGSLQVWLGVLGNV